MPHKAYGIEWPIYQEPKTKAGKRGAAFTLPTPQPALTEGAHYWPPEALPFAYAWACVEIALLRSQESNAAYYEIVRVLDLPGCQALLRNAISESSNTQKKIGKFFKAIERGHAIPMLSLNTDRQYENDPDYQLYIARVREFIRVSFNRQTDRDNQRFKVIAEKAPFLFSAVVIRTIAEYCRVKLADWNKYRSDNIDYVMTTKDPTTRPEREYVRLKRKEISTIYKKCLKWVFRHNAKLLKDADQWYKCRVSPGSIEAYLQELADLDKIGQKPRYPDRSRIENDIALCDEATGYPRKWRKRN